MDILSILVLFFMILIGIVFTGSFYDAIWVPTRKGDYERIAQLANLQSKMIFYDLGSGNANMLFYLSKKYSIHCVGIEISLFWYFYSKAKSLFNKKVEIRYGNLYKHDISKADVIYAFLLPEAYSKLKGKIDKEAKKGAKVILSYWPFENREPNNVARKKGSAPYYLYQKE